MDLAMKVLLILLTSLMKIYQNDWQTEWFESLVTVRRAK